MEKLGKEMAKALGPELVRDSPEELAEKNLRREFKDERYRLQNEISGLRRKLDDSETKLKAAEADLDLARRQRDGLSDQRVQVQTELAQAQAQLKQGESPRNFKLKVRVADLEEQLTVLRAAAAQSAQDRDAEAVRQLKELVVKLQAENSALRMAPAKLLPVDPPVSPSQEEPKFVDLSVQVKGVSGLQT